MAKSLRADKKRSRLKQMKRRIKFWNKWFLLNLQTFIFAINKLWRINSKVGRGFESSLNVVWHFIFLKIIYILYVNNLFCDLILNQSLYHYFIPNKVRVFYCVTFFLSIIQVFRALFNIYKILLPFYFFFFCKKTFTYSDLQ